MMTWTELAKRWVGRAAFTTLVVATASGAAWLRYRLL